MRSLRWIAAALLVASLVTLSACGRDTKQEGAPTVTLEGIRKEVAASFDGTTSSAQRQAAGDEAMRQFLVLLGQPDSMEIGDSDWSASPRPGVEQLARHFELDGGLHLYALSAPGSTLVESRERLAVQVRKTGAAPWAEELLLLRGGKVEAARAFKEGSRQMLAVLLRTAEREGYVGLFAAEGEGRFELVRNAFEGMVGQFGDLTLGAQEGFLTVSAANQSWAPGFDAKEPLRLRLGPEVMLDWKQGYRLVDDSRFDPFYMMALAGQIDRCKGSESCPEAILELARRAPKEAAAAAWQQATAKLAALLQKESDWPADLLKRLPPSSRLIRQEGRDLVATLLSVPAPEGLSGQAFTAIQFRTSGGMPVVRSLDLSGPVVDYRVMAQEGLPALLLVLDQPGDQAGGQKSQRLELLRLDAGNDWQKAEGWVGAVPEASHWNLTGISPDGLSITWESGQTPPRILLEAGPEGRVGICKSASDCHYLTWVDGRLHSLDILVAQLREATQQLPEGQLLWRANQLVEFLRLVDPAEVPAARMARLLDPDGRLGIQVLEVGGGTRLVTMPQNPSGLGLAAIHTQAGAQVVKVYDGYATRWADAKVVSGGSQQRLLLLGRSNKGAVLLAYDWDGTRWLEVDVMEAAANRVIKESMVVLHTPGSTRPVRGLIVTGGNKLQATLTETGASFCEDARACVRYGYDASWGLK